MKIKWKKVNNQLSNLNVMIVNDKEVAFIYKPKDTKTTINAWRCYMGIGEQAHFLAHSYDKAEAKKLTVEACGFE